MTAEVKETKYEKAQVPDEERCLFTKRDGSRCKSAHMGNASRQCILHEGRNQKADEAEAQAIAEQLLANDVELRTKDDVNRLTSQLFTMVAAKKISRQDGSLLAYIASVLLQTIAPVRKKPNVERVEEFFESVAEPIPATREEFNRKVAERFAQEKVQFPRHNAGVFGEQAGTLGKNHNPYLHPGKVR
jgi:signal recognition particle GTPase